MTLNSLDSLLSWLVEGLPGFPPKPVHSHHPLNINPSFSELLVPPELSLLATSPLPQTPPKNPPTSASLAITLPKREAAPDKRFLSYKATTAGRAVVLELYAPADATRAQREALWLRYQSVTDLYDLGLAAQSLERVGLNWRQAKSTDEILQASERLAQGSAN